MATSIGTAWIQIKPATKGLRQAISSELNTGSSDAGEDAGSKWSSGFAAKMGAVAGVAQTVFNKVAGIVEASFSAGIERASVLSNYTKVMGNLNIASDDAKASIDKMADKLTGLPTALDDAALAVQRFTSKNNDVAKSTDMFLAINNALIAGGASATVQAQALEQISQAYAKGKPDLVEWRSIMQSMPAQATQIAKAFGTTSEGLGEALRKGEISMDAFMAKVMEMNENGAEGFKSFEEQARNATDTLQTRLTVLRQSVTKTIAAALNGDDITPFLDQLVQRFNAVAPQILTAFIKAFTGIASKLPEVIPPILEAIVGAIPDIFAAIKELIKGLLKLIPQIMPQIVQGIFEIIYGVIDILTDPEVLQLLFQAAIAFFMQLVQSLPDIILALYQALPDIIIGIVDFLTNPDNIIMIVKASVQLFMGIVKAIPQILVGILNAFSELFSRLWETLKKNFGEFVNRFGDFIKGIFKGAINIVLAFLEEVVNAPIRLLNGFIDLINGAFGWIGVNIGQIGLISLPRLAQGGIVGGIGTDTSDSNIVALSKGEYVIKASSAREIGYDNLDRMNSTGQLSGGNVVTNITINGYNKSPEELANIISRKIALNTQGVLA